MKHTLKVNGGPHMADVDVHTPLFVGAEKCARHDRHQI